MILCRFLLKLYRSLGHGLKMCINCIYSSIFLSHFSQVELSHFMAKVNMNRFKVFCVGNSFYSFMPILLKFYRCLGHDLKMCVSFRNNPHSIFVTFLQVELSHFSGIITFEMKR